MQNEKTKFFKTDYYEVEREGYKIYLSHSPDFPTEAVIEGEFIDVSDLEWEDFDGMINRIISRYKGVI